MFSVLNSGPNESGFFISGHEIGLGKKIRKYVIRLFIINQIEYVCTWLQMLAISINSHIPNHSDTYRYLIICVSNFSESENRSFVSICIFLMMTERSETLSN